MFEYEGVQRFLIGKQQHSNAFFYIPVIASCKINSRYVAMAHYFFVAIIGSHLAESLPFRMRDYFILA